MKLRRLVVWLAIACGSFALTAPAAAQTSDRSYDWLVCRYSPPGNQDGKPVLVPRLPKSETPPKPERG